MGVYLRVKFERSNIILTGSRQRVILPPTPQNEPLKSPPRLGLILILLSILSTYILLLKDY